MFFLSITSNTTKQLIISVGLITGGFMLLSLEAQFASIITQYIELKAEYTLSEQLTNLCIIFIIQTSFVGYLIERQAKQVKLAITYLMLALSLYLGENNLISEGVQPCIGAGLFFYASLTLFSMRAWKSLILMGLGIFSIFLGWSFDHLQEIDSQDLNLTSKNILLMFDSLGYREDRYDFVGILLISLSTFLAFLSPLDLFIRNNGIKLFVLAVVSSSIIASGNSFIHYGYDPGAKLYSAALGLSVLGFSGLAFAIYGISREFLKAKRFSVETIWGFLFVLFVVLPGTFGGSKSEDVQSLVLWLPTLVFLSHVLWRKHKAADL